MVDDVALRKRRSRLHQRGDHSLCKAGRCGVDASVTVLPQVRDMLPGLVERYRDTLRAAGRLESPEGEQVMALAVLLAQARPGTPGVAALSRELRVTFEAAMSGAVRSTDGVDELEVKRRARILGA